MNKFRIILLVVIILSSISVWGGSKTQQRAYLGKFGIIYNNNEDYSSYIGKDVMYIAYPTNDFKCQQNTVLTINKISTTNKKMTINLVEKGGKKKYKMEVTLGLQLNFRGDYEEEFYLGKHSNSPTVPLLLLDEYNKLKKNIIGKEITNEVGTTFKFIDIKIMPENIFIIYEIAGSEGNYSFNAGECIDYIDEIGRVFRHPKAKYAYEIVSIDNEKYGIEAGVRRVGSKSNNIIGYKLEEVQEKCFSFDLEKGYVASLSKVEKPENSKIRYGNTKIINDSTVTKYNYVDNIIDILIFANLTEFSFILKNISNHSIRIIWNDAAFVDIDGETSKIMHSGIKYSQRETDQPASTIIKGAKLYDIACPIKNVRYSEILKEWMKDPLFNKEGQIKLMLPIQIKDVINEYVFVFDVKNEYLHPSRVKNVSSNGLENIKHE